MNKNSKPTALIVGGSSGIDLATAKQLAETSINLIIVGKSTNKLAKVKDQLLQLTEVTTWQTDLYQDNQHSLLANKIQLSIWSMLLATLTPKLS